MRLFPYGWNGPGMQLGEHADEQESPQQVNPPLTVCAASGEVVEFGTGNREAGVEEKSCGQWRWSQRADG
ncbi:hypothetical protein IMZ48_22490, partial [Candidatus Bathyarchaeota archaeon]|nr:hypothetical protein [Candidatus Bathyarchaeota archaeon]